MEENKGIYLFRNWAKEKGYSVGKIRELCLAKGVNIPRSTLGDYLYLEERKSISRKDYADVFADISGIEQIKEAFTERRDSNIRKRKPKEDKSLSELEQLLISIRKLGEAVSTKYLGSAGYEPDIEERIAVFNNLINNAIEQVTHISTYYRANPNEIQGLTEKITKGIRQENAGYLVSVLNAIFDKDRFKSWILMADYNPRVRK